MALIIIRPSKDWYNSLPDIYGNANLLPISDSSINNVLMLDVLEHLPDPEKCL